MHIIGYVKCRELPSTTLAGNRGQFPTFDLNKKYALTL